MEDHDRDVLSLLNEIMYAVQEILRRKVMTAVDVASNMVIVPDVDHQIVFVGLLVALDDLCEFLGLQLQRRVTVDRARRTSLVMYLGAIFFGMYAAVVGSARIDRRSEVGENVMGSFSVHHPRAR